MQLWRIEAGFDSGRCLGRRALDIARTAYGDQASGWPPDKTIGIAVLSACNCAASVCMEVGSKATRCGAAPCWWTAMPMPSARVPAVSSSAALLWLDLQGIAACAIAHPSARIGDARSTLAEGAISRAKASAEAPGAKIDWRRHDWLEPAGAAPPYLTRSP